MEFKNRVVLITGASTGIGKELARELSKTDCRLVLTARRIDLLEELKKELMTFGNEILAVKCDVGKKNEVETAYKTIMEKFGGVDIAILNAGVGISVAPKNYNSRAADETFGANFFGIVYWVEQLLPDFIKRRNGIIAGVSSLADNRGFSGSGFYCASKAAASIYLEGLRIDLNPYNIKVITVRPGFVKTPMTDQNKFKMPFLLSARDAAKRILKGIRKEKRIVQFPLQMVILTRLLGLIPSRVYEYLSSKTNRRV